MLGQGMPFVQRKLTRWLIEACVLICLPIAAAAQTMTWDPLNMDLGQVTVGTTGYGTLTLTNTDSVYPLVVSHIHFTYNDGDQFGFTTSKPLAAVLLAGESMDVVLSFTPIGDPYSFSMAEIRILTDAINAPTLYYSVMALGVEGDSCAPMDNCGGLCVDTSTDLDHCGACYNVCPVVANATSACDVGACEFTCDPGYVAVGQGCEPIQPQTPLEMLDDLIAFVEASHSEGTLEGFGPGYISDSGPAISPERRFQIFLDQLGYVRVNLEAGDTQFLDQACRHLNWLHLRSDGGWLLVLPPDFIAGSAAPAVHEAILDIMAAIGICEVREAIARP